MPGAVVGGGVEERDAEIERSIEGAQRFGVVDLLQPAGAPLNVHGPPIAQQPIPRALTSMPDRPSTRVKGAVMEATIWRVAVDRKCDPATVGGAAPSTGGAQRPHGRVDPESSEQALTGRPEAADRPAHLAADLPIRERVVALEEQQHPLVLGIEAGRAPHERRR